MVSSHSFNLHLFFKITSASITHSRIGFIIIFSYLTIFHYLNFVSFRLRFFINFQFITYKFIRLFHIDSFIKSFILFSTIITFFPS
jgi:hypothetical protein